MQAFLFFSLFFYLFTLAEVGLEIWGCNLTIYRNTFIIFSFDDKSQIRALKIHSHVLSFITEIRVFEGGNQTLVFSEFSW